MKRLLLGCLGMVFLGAAGLLILQQFVQFPSPARAQPSGGAGAPAPGPGPAGTAGAPGGPAAAAEAGQYKQIIPALLDALADPDGNVRLLAASTLIKIGPDAVPPLIEALQKAKDRETRANAAYVLGHFGDSAQEALPALA